MYSKLFSEYDVMLPTLPASLAGLRIGHLTDLHITKPRRRWTQMIQGLANRRLDLLLMTGDYMSYTNDEPAAKKIIETLLLQVKPKYGIYGTWGNHDTSRLKQMLAAMPITWLNDQCVTHPILPLQLMGLEAMDVHFGDVASVAKQGVQQWQGREGQPVRLLLSHYPDTLPMASDIGVDMVFSGHTHGGQIRLPNRYAPVNHTQLPEKMSSGLIRYRQTLLSLSRGVGEVLLPLRLFCPPQIVILNLRQGRMLGQDQQQLQQVIAW